MEGVVYMTLFTHVFREVMLGGLLASCNYIQLVKEIHLSRTF